MLSELRFYLPAKENFQPLFIFLGVCGAFFFVILFLWVALQAKEYLTYPTQARLQRQLEAELKPGASKEEVLKFLDQQRIGHGSFHKIKQNEKVLSQEFTFFGRERLQGKLDRIQHRIYSGATVANLASLTECWTDIWFYFDEDGKLVDYVMNGYCDGL